MKKGFLSILSPLGSLRSRSKSCAHVLHFPTICDGTRHMCSSVRRNNSIMLSPTPRSSAPVAIAAAFRPLNGDRQHIVTRRYQHSRPPTSRIKTKSDKSEHKYNNNGHGSATTSNNRGGGVGGPNVVQEKKDDRVETGGDNSMMMMTDHDTVDADLMRKMKELETKMAQDRRALHFLAKRVMDATASTSASTKTTTVAVGATGTTPSSSSCSVGTPSTMPKAQCEKGSRDVSTTSSTPPSGTPPPPSTSTTPSPSLQDVLAVEARLKALNQQILEVAATITTARGEVQRALDVGRQGGSRTEASVRHSVVGGGSGSGNRAANNPTVGNIHAISPQQWRRVHELIATAESEVSALKRTGAGGSTGVGATTTAKGITESDSIASSAAPLKQQQSQQQHQLRSTDVQPVARLLTVDIHGEPRSVWSRVLVTNIQHVSLTTIRLHCNMVGSVVIALIRHLNMPSGAVERAAVLTYRSNFDAQRAVELLNNSVVGGVRIRVAPYFDSPDPTVLAVTDDVIHGTRK